MDSNRNYRIRTAVGNEKPFRIDVPLTQTYDTFEILSLKLKQKNEYNYYDSDYGVIVGRVIANGNFGIPNAKVSVFIEVDEEESLNRKILYNFVSTQDANLDGVRYNLLPDFVDNACHQDVGTFPNKRLVLDNKDVLEIFDKYYKYTTVTNESGDYMLFGIPTGMQNVHVDLDMSDIGKLSQRPRDMVYKGYNINQFESPNKFKKSTNLNSLSQIYSQDKGVFVYSYWGNSNNRDSEGQDHIAITRCDVQIEYKFEPTCIFIGSIITDKGSNAIGKNCTGTDNVGKMSDLSTGEGTIEMIRKTVDGKVEEFPIKGNRLIDGDGVWCYQIPMNLDYVMTDEFGNIVPTDDPSKGIPTRTRARFRISLDESPNDATARKRCKFLVPNNPRYDKVDYPQFYQTKEADYEFGSATREESYCDMFWNNVYTVKSYIPRLQKNKNATNRKHTGIKLINHYGDNNPMPYNSLSIKLSFTYRLICVLVKVLIWIIATINQILGFIMEPICQIGNLFLEIAKKLCFSILGVKPLCWMGTPFKWLGKLFKAMVVKGITLGSSFCDDGINRIAFYPTLTKIAQCVLDKVKDDFNKEQNGKTNPEERERLKVITLTSMDNNELITCIENSLAQSNDATSFNFQNDWVNGVLYAPLWYRKITPKKSFLFGLFKRKAKDQWCRADGNFNLMVYQACALKKASGTVQSPLDSKNYAKPISVINDCGDNCHKNNTIVNVNNGLILTRETMLGQTVYYYKALEYNQQLANNNGKDGVVLLFATDIVLLGSLNDCDSNGIPQFFKNLESTTYNLPTDILFTDTIIQVDAEGNVVVNGNNDIMYEQFTEATGCDWGNLNDFDECGEMGKHTDSGLFYGIGCSTIEMTAKSCLNLSRICEFGVSLDDAKDVPDLEQIEADDSGFERLTPDGFISFDELYNINERSMFATLNGNRLRTRLNNKNGLKEYDLRYLYTDNFDGLMKDLMRTSGDCNYVNNHNLEQMSNDYYLFRMGTEPFYYDSGFSLPRYENSFYFYFGLKMGKTAIDKFNSQFFASCEDGDEITSPISVEVKPNSWCTNDSNEADGYVLLDLTNISKPCNVILNSQENTTLGFEEEIKDNVDKIFLGTKKVWETNYSHFPDYNLLPLYIVKDDKRYYVNGNKITINGKDFYKNDKSIIKEDDVVNGQKVKRGIDDIPNGEYELIITDADGETISYKFSMMTQKVQFTYNKVDNETPNNQRFAEYNNYSLLFETINDDNKSDYGGYIEIDSVIDNFEDLGDDKYRCYLLTYEITSKLEDDSQEEIFTKGYGGSVKLEVNNKGIITDIDKLEVNNNSVFLSSNGTVIILTPLGNIDYNIKIIEMCDCSKVDDISGNNCSYFIHINDTLPFKLFVNNIDVETFKDISTNKWKIGWDDKIAKPEITNLGIGWLNLISLDNFNDYYDITKIEGYEQIEEQKQQLITNYDECKNQLNKLIEQFIDVSDNSDLIKNKEGSLYEKNYLREYYREQFRNINNVCENIIRGEYSPYDNIDKAIVNLKEEIQVNIIQKSIDNQNIETSMNISQISYIGDLIKDKYVNYIYIAIEYKEGIDNEGIETKFKKEFLQSIKETFWLTSETDPKNITITVQTKKLPVEYYLKYCAEESGSKQGVNVLNEEGNKYEDIDTEIYSVSDILMPTITNSDNENYGYDGNNTGIKKGNISFGYDREHGYNEQKNLYNEIEKWVKKPYGIRIVNSKGDKLPVKGNVTLDSEQYFFFHLIDKILKFKMVAWSYIKDIPYPPTADENYKAINKFINLTGLVDGEIHNGILENDAFSSFKLGKYNITNIKTIDNENRIPTRRYIDETIDNIYPDYKVGESRYENNYIPVAYKQDVLNIEDTITYISETIYGNMSVSLSSNSTKGRSLEFIYNVKNGDNDGQTKLILIKHDNGNNEYPLSVLTSDNKLYGMNDTNKIMSYYTTFVDLCKKSKDSNLINEVGIITDEGEEKEIVFGDNGSLYSENGKFMLNNYNNNLVGQKFYVVAVTNNNCRSLSPLYHFITVNINALLTTLNTIVEKEEGVYDNIVSYKFGLEIPEPPYYLQYYNSNIDFNFALTSELKIQKNEIMLPGNEVVFFDMEDTMYQQLKMYFANSLFFIGMRNKLQSSIKLTDITKLSLPIEVNGLGQNESRQETFYAVVYDLSEVENISENEDINLTIYESSEHEIKYEWFIGGIPVKNGFNFVGWQLISTNKNEEIKDTTLAKIEVKESFIVKPIFEQISFEFNTNDIITGNGTWVDTTIINPWVVDGTTNNDKFTFSKDNIIIGNIPSLTPPTNKEFDKWVCQDDNQINDEIKQSDSNQNKLVLGKVTNVEKVIFTATYKDKSAS